MAFLIAVLLSSPWAGGEVFHVAPGGNDDDPGSVDRPWKTIRQAVKKAGPGDTVLIRSGIYAERVEFTKSGTAEDGYITFKAAPGADVIVDGTGQAVSGRQGLVEIVGESYLRIEGLVVRNFQSSIPGRVPVGILVEGACSHLEIVGNEICDIASLAIVDKELNGRDAHGLAVYGTAATPITDLLIRDNELHSLTLGSSEALAVNGNVQGFQVLDNEVSHCDNIGIDLIGFEGIAPSEALDQVRDGVVAGNRVWRIDTATNPAYAGETSAAGIYVDGGRDLVVERNTVTLCNIGIEVASEHFGKVTRAITVRNNLLARNEMGGLFMGGYDELLTGSAEDCVISNNTFYNNDTDPLSDEYGQIYIQYRVSNCVFKNNIFYPLVVKDFRLNPMIMQWNASGSGNVFDHNLYFGPATPLWRIMNVEREGWVAYASDPLSGSEERYGDPQFVDSPGEDFTPRGAAAVGTGDAGAIGVGDRDWEGDAIVPQGGVERGAVQSGREEFGVVRLAVEVSGGQLDLKWPGREGFYYDIEARVEGCWETVPGSEALSGTGLEMTRSFEANAAAALLRVKER